MFPVLNEYMKLYRDYPEVISGIGFFLWPTLPGDNPGERYIGARDIPHVQEIIEWYIPRR